MEAIPNNNILEYPPDTLEEIRKKYDLHQPGRMDEAIDLLEDWIKKQSHFVVRKFPRSYLERTIISAKGSVERAKQKMDKNCTIRGLTIKFYFDYNSREDLEYTVKKFSMYSLPLPKFAQDYKRVCFMKMGSLLNAASLSKFFDFLVVIWEYMKANDYMDGVIVVNDMRDFNILDFVKDNGITNLRQICTMLVDGMGLRLSGIHLISESPTVNTLVTVLKQILNKKLGNRICVHKAIDTLYEYIPKDILPAEYGGKENSIEELREQWLTVLSEKNHIHYMKEIKKAVTDESKRNPDEFDKQYLGLPGSFRTLTVD